MAGKMCLLSLALISVLVISGRAQSPVDSAAKFFISAPNVFRVGVDETVVISLLEPQAVQITVEVFLRRPGTRVNFATASVTVTAGSPQNTTLRVDAADIKRPGQGWFEDIILGARSLHASYPFQDTKEVLVSMQSGYVFVQTDKPIYTPNQRVFVRGISLEQNMLPSDRDLRVEVKNPQGISVRRFFDTRATHGFLSADYTFPPRPVFGNWSVVAFYGPEYQLNSTVKFEVKEYVLPKFFVKLRPPMYILEGINSFTTEIEARYVFGKPVIGRYLFKFGVVEEDGSVTYFEQTRSARLLDGRASVTLDNLDDVFGDNWFDWYEHKRFHAEAIVHETVTGISEASVNQTAVFVVSPYKFSKRRTLDFFKRGLALHVLLDLTFVNGYPAGEVPVNVRATAALSTGNEPELLDVVSITDEMGRLRTSINVPSDAETIHITCSTRDPDFADMNQGSSVFQILAASSPNREYMVVLPQNDTHRYNVGQLYSFQILRAGSQTQQDIHHMFISGGRIVTSGVLSNEGVNPTLDQIITQDMVPRTRLVVYYVTPEGHVISDSLLLDVEELCRGEVSIAFETRPPPLPSYYQPSYRTDIIVSAPTGSSVGILGVDKAVYHLKDSHRLTRREMFERMEGYDMGCGPGGGQTSSQVFKDSGLTVLTNTGLDVARRESIKCASSAQLSSASDPALSCQTDAIVQCLSAKPALVLRLRNSGSGWTCSLRARVIAQECDLDMAARQIYQQWCELFLQLDETLVSVTAQGPSRSSNFNRRLQRSVGLRKFGHVLVEVEPELELEDVHERFDFRETWFFEEMSIPETENGQFGGMHTVSYVAPSSMTEWKLSAVSVSPSMGMCIDDSASLNVFQSFSIQLHMPYSVIRLEQAEIIATIFNYRDYEMNNVVVNFTVPDDGLCTEGRPGVPITRVINVPANNAASVSFVVRPVDVGNGGYPIRISAGPGSTIQDRIMKYLRVVAEGKTKEVVSTVVLNPGRVVFVDEQQDMATQTPADHVLDTHVRQEGDRQILQFNLSLPQEFIPGTEFCKVSLIGSLPNNVDVDPITGLERWVRQSYGSGEDTMMRMAPALYAYKYIQATGQDTPVLDRHIHGYLADGIARELTFRQNNGAYAAWTTRPGSTWLTAFVIKTFSEASQLTEVEAGHVKQSIAWIIDNNQNAATGIFSESQHVLHQEMIGAVKGDVSMTAFVLISLLESKKKLVGGYDKLLEVNGAIPKAKQYLEGEVEGRNIERVYDKAIVAYALALADSSHAIGANDILIEDEIVEADTGAVHFDPDPQNYGISDKPYWLLRRPSAISVETTAYALLAQMELGKYRYAGRLAAWLSNQQNYDGGFLSTQDTVVATQALATYAGRPKFEHVNLDLFVHSARSPDLDFAYRIDDENAQILKETPVTSAIGDLLTLHARGYGVGKAQVVLGYNQAESDIDTCPFNVTIVATEVRTTNQNMPDFLNITVCVRYLGESSTHMGIIDVGLYSGFRAVTADLEKLTNSGGLIASYEHGQRSIIFYVDQIPNEESLCFSFKAQSDAVVGNIQPVAVHVYDLYNPHDTCTVFYRPGDGSPLLINLCAQYECICARRGACIPPRQRSTQAVLELAACTGQDAYALKVRVDSIIMKGGFIIVNVTVMAVIKPGMDYVSPGEKRQIYLDSSCRSPRFSENKNYLVVGRKGLKFTMPSGQPRYKYVIDSETKVEFWPSERERNRRTGPLIDKLNSFLEILTTRGCAT